VFLKRNWVKSDFGDEEMKPNDARLRSMLFSEGQDVAGVELAYRVMLENDPDTVMVKPVFSIERSKEYWLGFYLAYYQWYRNLPFAQITERVGIGDIQSMYRKYHEMDITQFVDALDEMRSEARMR
jgi:hypothetical protein